MEPIFASEILGAQGATSPVHALLEAELSHSEIATALRNALKAANPGSGTYYWPREVYAANFVYELDAAGATKLYQRPYSIDDAGKVTLGDAVEVTARTVYEPVTTPVSEAAAMPDGSMSIMTAADMKKALAAMGSAPDKAALKAHIIARAKALGMMSMLPDDWQPAKAKESAVDVQLEGDLIPLVEAKGGKLNILAIQAGWGASGHYSADVLKRDGPAAFPAGTKMYPDHPTVTEEAQRPERSVRDVAAIFDTPATWQDDGPMGPGLYATATVTKQYRPLVEELAPHIGVSIRALGKARTGTVDGRTGKIIESIVAGKSVDFVTQAGAGGRYQQLLEAARNGNPPPAPTPTVKEPNEVTPEEATRLQEAQTATNAALTAAQATIARLQEVNLLREARDFVATTLRGMQMAEPTRVRLIEQLAAAPVVKDGAIDVEAFRTHIQETAKAEVAYLTSVTGAGRISGMGSVSALSEAPSAEVVTASLEEAFGRLGLKPESAKIAAAGR